MSVSSGSSFKIPGIMSGSLLKQVCRIRPVQESELRHVYHKTNSCTRVMTLNTFLPMKHLCNDVTVIKPVKMSKYVHLNRVRVS